MNIAKPVNIYKSILGPIIERVYPYIVATVSAPPERVIFSERLEAFAIGTRIESRGCLSIYCCAEPERRLIYRQGFLSVNYTAIVLPFQPKASILLNDGYCCIVCPSVKMGQPRFLPVLHTRQLQSYVILG